MMRKLTYTTLTTPVIKDKLYGVKESKACPPSPKQEKTMRVPTGKLQQLAIFTTLLTGSGVGTMYYFIQKGFSRSDYHRLALERLEANPVAMESLGAPPLNVYNIRLSDRHNKVDQQTAQIKIPVKGSKTGGYLYTSSIKDSDANRWNLQLAVLHVKEGQVIDLLAPPPPSSQQPDDMGWEQDEQLD